tara:strand:- start:197 stop:379 length:183 start_codon:yes stop_codon:yes gene_type:complete
MAINNRVNAIPDLMPEANKFTTFGDKKIIKKRGNMYIKWLLDFIFTAHIPKQINEIVKAI